MKLPIKKKYFDEIKSGEKTYEVRDGKKVYQKGKMLNKIGWLSHKYKCEVVAG